MTKHTILDQQTVALVSLTRSNIGADIQELLLEGNPDRGIAPGALARLLEQVVGHTSTAFNVISDIRAASRLGHRPMLSELAEEIRKIRDERDAALARAEKAEAELTGMEARAIHAETMADEAMKNHPKGVITQAGDILDAIRACPTEDDALLCITEAVAAERERCARIYADAIQSGIPFDWWTTPHDRLGGKRPCDDPANAALLINAIAHGLPA